MARVILAGIVGGLIGYVVATILFERKARTEAREKGIAQMIQRGVHPDDAGAAYDREFRINVNFNSVHYFPMAVTGVASGFAVGAFGCALALYWTSRRRNRGNRIQSDRSEEAPMTRIAGNSQASGDQSGSREGFIRSVVILILFVTAVGLAVFTWMAYREAKLVQVGKSKFSQVGLALVSYQAANGSLPPRITVDEDGNVLHSWRTLLLPFLERNDLYERIDLTKPWDAPENADAINESVEVYQHPSSSPGSTATRYLAIYGDDTVFHGSEALRSSRIDVPPIVIVEAGHEISHWAKPDDVSLNDIRQRVSDNNIQENYLGKLALRSDGGVETLPASIAFDWLVEATDGTKSQQ